MALFNVRRPENHLNIEIRLEGSGKEWVAMGMDFVLAVGVLHVELQY